MSNYRIRAYNHHLHEELSVLNDKTILADEPIPLLACLLLLQAEGKKASSLILEFDNGKMLVKYDISGKIIDNDDPPPGYLWANLFNIYIRLSGNEYWRKGDVKGIISIDRFLHSKWELNASADHRKIIFNKIE